jgi:hypothetical protein
MKMSEFYLDSEDIEREQILNRIDQLREKIPSLKISNKISDSLTNDNLKDLCLIWCNISLYKIEHKCNIILRKLRMK